MRSSPPSNPELAAEAEHFRLAQEAGEIGTWDWDLAIGRMKWSAQMFRNMGLPPGSDVSHGALIAAIHPDDRAAAEAAFGEFRTRPGPLRLEARLAFGSEEGLQWVVFLGKVIADAAGKPVRALGVTIDSTRRRRTEEAREVALRDSERRLQELNERLEQLAEQRARQLDASRAQ